MSGFLYFIPERQSLEPADLAELGLGYVFDCKGYSIGRIRQGPDGEAGILVAWAEGWETRLGYRPEEQAWRSVPGSPARVGYYRADPPKPAGLLRPRPLPGRPVELGDGQSWSIPIIRTWRGDEDPAFWTCDLPTVAGVDDAGNWTTDQIVPRYAELYRQALRYFDVKRGATVKAAQAAESEAQGGKPARVSMTFTELYDVALALLGTNYRIGKAEVALLGLFTSDVAVRILDAAIDWGTLEAWLEKKTPPIPDSSPTDAGPAVSPPGTGQPSGSLQS